MRIAATGALFLLATSSLAQPVGPAVPLTNTRYSTAGEAAVASLASNGRTFLAAWGTPTGVRTSRLSGAAASIGVPVGKATGDAPAIAANGSGYVIADSDGLHFLDGNGLPLGYSVSFGTAMPRARIASNGHVMMVVYPRPTFQFDVLAAFIEQSGNVLQKDVRVGTNTATGSSPLPFAVAADANGFAFISEDGPEIQLKMFDNEGNPRRTATLDGFSPVARYTAVASDGRYFVALWTEEDNSLHAAQFRSIDGLFIDKTTILAPSAGHAPTQPSLAFDGDSFVCSYRDGSDVMMVRIKDLDLTAGEPVTLGSAASSPPSVAAANGVAMTAWSRTGAPIDNLGLGGVVYARAVTTDGVAGGTFPVSAGAHDQTSAAAATNGIETLVAWLEGDGQQVSLMGGLLRADGAWRELGALESGGSVAPLVASDGHDFLVIGAEGARRVSADGVLLDGTPASLGHLFPTGLAWSGHDYVAVGEIDHGSVSSPGLGALSISASGAVGTLHDIRPPVFDDRAERPGIASSGSDFLVTFTVFEPPSFGGFFPIPGGSGGRALRLSQSLDRVGSEIETDAVDTVTSTAVAWNGSEYLALAVNDKALDSVRMARDGTILGRRRLNPDETTTPGTPSVAAVGEDFFVTWREGGAAGTIGTGTGFVCIARGDGTAGTPAAFPESGLSSTDPIVVAYGNGAHVIRPRFLDAPPYFGAERLVMTAVGAADPPDTPALAVQSTSEGAILSWSAALAVNGYRIEYRNSRHDWEEIETWQLPDARTFPVVFDRGDIYEFRVKAIGWGGASYSNIASFDPTRRRAVR